MTPRPRRTQTADHASGAPFLRRVVGVPEKFEEGRYPFTIRAFSRGIDLTFPTNVTFFVGENGSGKSTLNAPGRFFKHLFEDETGVDPGAGDPDPAGGLK